MVTSSMLRVTDSWGRYLVYADLLQGQSAHICMSPKGVKKGLSRHALRQRSRCSICSYLNINIPGSKHWQPNNSSLATYTEILIDKIPDSQRKFQIAKGIHNAFDLKKLCLVNKLQQCFNENLIGLQRSAVNSQKLL